MIWNEWIRKWNSVSGSVTGRKPPPDQLRFTACHSNWQSSSHLPSWNGQFTVFLIPELINSGFSLHPLSERICQNALFVVNRDVVAPSNDYCQKQILHSQSTFSFLFLDSTYRTKLFQHGLAVFVRQYGYLSGLIESIIITALLRSCAGIKPICAVKDCIYVCIMWACVSSELHMLE